MYATRESNVYDTHIYTHTHTYIYIYLYTHIHAHTHSLLIPFLVLPTSLPISSFIIHFILGKVCRERMTLRMRRGGSVLDCNKAVRLLSRMAGVNTEVRSKHALIASWRCQGPKDHGKLMMRLSEVCL